ncbi:SrfA family protein [Halochromatium sp.]
MPGPLLKSATLKTYHPVGAVGHPVYLAAAQLRAAIGRRLGADVADVFAIPQRNEDGDSIDWYAPNPGTVVPWSAATEAERVTAQSCLLEVRERIEDLGRSMEAEASAERQVFGRLLAQVMQFPDEQDVHLVNGQPVLTFWGFVRDRAEVGSDPLRDLSLHVAPQAGKRVGAGAGAAGDPADKQPPANGRPWWLWLLLALLLLLLLALLLWGLRGCVPMLDPTGEPTPNSESMPNSEPMPGSDSLEVDQSEGLNLFGQARRIEDVAKLSEMDTITTRRDARVDGDDIGPSIRERVERTFSGGGVSSVRDATTASSTTETLAAETMIDNAGVDADVLADRVSVEDDRSDKTLAIEGLEDSGPMTLGGEADLPLADAAEALATDTQGQDPGDALVADEVLSDVAAADPLAADEQADGAAAEGLSGPASEPNKVEGDGAGEGESDGAGEGEGGTSASDTGDEASAADQAVALTDASAPAADGQAPTGADAASAAADAAAAPSTDSSASEDASSASTLASGSDASAAAADARAASAGTGTSTPTGAVRIPPRELLNSSWRTTRTLQDPKDGSPVRLDYRLQDGSGKVRLTRQDGSLCQSDAQATVRDGRLVVDSQQDIVCADGTNFGRPQLDCTPQVGGRARCVGRYADGSSVPIEMRRQSD